MTMPWADVNRIKGGPGFRFILTLLSLDTVIVRRDRMVLTGENEQIISEVNAEIKRRT